MFEKVVVKIDHSGSLKQTPEQITRVSVVGDSPVTVSVPVTSTRLHKKDKGGRPQVVDEQAKITLDPNGTAVQELKSKFHAKLPVAVTISYYLNGKPIAAKDIRRKSGTLELRYELANVTSESVSTCFEGFDGKQQNLTVSAPLPIIASLSLTVPSEATSFEAPGASLSTARKGVSVGWTPSLFEPLGSAEQTFTVKMNMTHVSIPKVSLYLFTLDPRTLSGSVPAQTALAVGKASAEQARIVASVQQELNALQRHVSNLSAPPRSTTKHRTADAPKVHSPTRRAQRATTPSRHVSSVASARVPTPTSPAHPGTLESPLADLSTALTSLAKMHAQVSHYAAALPALAARVHDDAAAVTSQLNETAAMLDGPVQNAFLEVQQLGQLQTDLGAFSPSVKSTPAYMRVASDLQLAKSTANQLKGSLDSVQQRIQAAAPSLATLQSDIASLETAVEANVALAAQAAETRLENDAKETLSHVSAGVARLEAELASAEKKLDDARASLGKAVAAGKAAARTTVADDEKAAAQRAAALQDAAASKVAAAQKAVAKEKAAARSAAEAAAQHAMHTVQASLDKSQTQLTKIDSQISEELSRANARYARTLALNQLAVLYQLPGGSATDATTQNGRFVYSIG